MRVALVGLEAGLTAQLAGWLGDEGHLPRRFGSAGELIGSDERDQFTAVLCTADALPAIGESVEVDCQLIVIGDDDGAGDVVLTPPLRRREVLRALAAS